MSDGASVRTSGFDDWLDALAADEGYYLVCENGHGSLPPRRVCPDCGSPALAEEPLPDEGELAAATVVRVATPSFVDDAPYVTAIVDLGPVRLTGQLRVDPTEVAGGMAVTVGVDGTETTGERVVVFEPSG